MNENVSFEVFFPLPKGKHYIGNFPLEWAYARDLEIYCWVKVLYGMDYCKATLKCKFI